MLSSAEPDLIVRCSAGEIPFEYKDIISDLIWISVCLGNLDQSLTSKDWEGDAFVPVQGMGSLDGEEVDGEGDDEMAIDDGMKLISDIAVLKSEGLKSQQ
eukprot:COSAG04_NODE_1812_length_5513_cov_55.382342_2_plen_100_part_00